MTKSFFLLPLANKNFLSSDQICKLVKKKFSRKVNLSIFSDGGDDADFIFKNILKYKKKIIRIYNYKKKKINCPYYVKDKSVFIHGKNVLGGNEKNIKTLNYSSYGIGQIIKKNLNKDYFYLSLGGSLNTDAGLGLLQSLGAKFILKKKKSGILCGKDLKDVKNIFFYKWQKNIFKNKLLFLISDSSVFPHGQRGQTKIFGKQKKMTRAQIEIHDRNIKKFCSIIYTNKKKYFKKYLGAGGGIGISLNSIFNTKIFNGSKFFFKKLNLEKKIINLHKSNILISTEGTFDHSSFFGKGFEFIRNFCKKKRIKFYFIVGNTKIRYKKKNSYIINLKSKLSNKENYKNKLLKKIEELLNYYEKKN